MGATYNFTFAEEHLGSIIQAEDTISQTKKHNHRTRNRHLNHSDHLSLPHKIQHNTRILTIIHMKIVNHLATKDLTIIKMAQVQIIVTVIVVIIHRMAMKITIETMDKTIARTSILRGKFHWDWDRSSHSDAK